MSDSGNERVLVSCVIPTHNRDHLLLEALHSVLNQTVDFLVEVIVVDDVGSIHTQALIKEFEAGTDGLMKLHYLSLSSADGQAGASSSRNAGAHMARGRYLAFLDDDDLWEPKYLKDAVYSLDTSRAAMAVTWMKVMERDGSIAPLLSIPDGLAAARVVSRNPGVTGSNIVINADVYGSLGGFDESLPVSNDKDFFLRFLLQGHSYMSVQTSNAIHRRHSGEQLTRPNNRRADGLQLYLDKHLALTRLKDRRFLRQHIHRIRSRTSDRPVERLFHFICSVYNYSFEDIVARARPHSSGTGRYSSV
jgi:glycosyltransferase involved in cell wall biosynthesis